MILHIHFGDISSLQMCAELVEDVLHSGLRVFSTNKRT